MYNTKIAEYNTTGATTNDTSIELLTATVQNEIKSNDLRYRSYDDSVIPCYMTTLVYRGIIDIIIDTAPYMTIILHRRGRQHNARTHRHYLHVHTF